jgi:predicted nucleotide-binding protein
MQKRKIYRAVRFDSKAISEADRVFSSLSSKKKKYGTLAVDVNPDERWTFDTLAEFLAAADRGLPDMSTHTEDWDLQLVITTFENRASISVAAPTRDGIETVFSVFEKNAERCRIPESEMPKDEAKVFIGHGQNSQWRDLKDHLHEKHGYQIEAYEIGSRAGHTIRDVLEEMMKESTFALLVMTGEDETKDGKLLARQNVVHEAGLFQGKLGFSRAIILLEEGTDEFSNIQGIQQIRFSKNKIKESFGDVLAVLKRELG